MKRADTRKVRSVGDDTLIVTVDIGMEESNIQLYWQAREYNTISKSKMILRRLGGGDEAYCTYVEEADDDANKNSALI